MRAKSRTILLILFIISSIVSAEVADHLPQREMQVASYYGGWFSAIDSFPSDWKRLSQSNVINLVKILPHPESGSATIPGAYIDAESGKLFTPANTGPRQIFQGTIETLAKLSGKDAIITPVSYHYERNPSAKMDIRGTPKDESKWLVFALGGFAAYSPMGNEKDDTYYDKLVAMPRDWEEDLASVLANGISKKWPIKYTEQEFNGAIKSKNYPLLALMSGDLIGISSHAEKLGLFENAHAIDSRLMRSWFFYRIMASVTDMGSADLLIKTMKSQIDDIEDGEESCLCIFYGSMKARQMASDQTTHVADQAFTLAIEALNKNPSWNDKESKSARILAPFLRKESTGNKR